VRKEISAAEAESAAYSGGLLKLQIDMRCRVLKTTEAMLEQKRSSVLRRINLVYTAANDTVQPASPAELKKIEDDIAQAKSQLAAAQGKANLYSGGLLQILALTTVATDRLSVAQLYFAYYSAKYGVPAPALSASAPVPKPPVGTVVPDKDAF
jgi:hypothetical protein